MFWKQTIKEIKNLSLTRYKNTQDRINKISDYIQGPLAETINKAAKIAATDAVIEWKKEDIFKNNPIYEHTKKK